MRAYNIKKSRKSSSCRSNQSSQQTDEVNTEGITESKDYVNAFVSPKGSQNPTFFMNICSK